MIQKCLNVINEHVPFMKTKFMRALAPWMKDSRVNKLQRERDRWRHEGHSKQTPKSWEKFKAIKQNEQNEKGYQREKDNFVQKGVSIKT